MTPADTETIADVVVAAVRAATAPLVERCAALEAQVVALEKRAPVPGPSGPRGDSGPPGERGADAVVNLDVVANRAAAIVQQQQPPTEPDLDPAIVSTTIAAMMREALGDALAPVKMKKVFVRDADGLLTSMHEEPA